MNTRVLFIDLFSPRGHVNFNQIYLNALAAIPNVQIDLALQEGYLEMLNLPDSIYSHSYSFKQKTYHKHSLLNKVLWRLSQYKAMQYCKELDNKNHYDYIFVSSFDEIVLSLYRPLSKKIIAVTHASADHIVNSPLAISRLAKLAKQIHLITLNKATSIYFTENGIPNTFVPHGFPLINTALKPLGRTIFIPIKNLMDDSLLQRIVSSQVSEILQKLRVKLILRDNPLLEHGLANIEFIPQYIPGELYTRLFSEAGMILLPYDREAYVYRTSAMLMEAIAYGRFVTVPKTKSFESLSCGSDTGMMLYNSFVDIISYINTIFSQEAISTPSFDKVISENNAKIITESIKHLMDE